MNESAFDLHFKMDTGEELTFVPSGVRPLTFADLARSAAPDTFKMEFSAPKATLNAIERVEGMTARATVQFQEPCTVFALVEGGWLPPPFVMPPTFLADRNVVSALQRVRTNSRPDVGATNWWFSLFREGYASFNPLLYAMEGNERRVPTFQDFVQAFDAGRAHIGAALPSSKIISFEILSRVVYEDLIRRRFSDGPSLALRLHF